MPQDQSSDTLAREAARRAPHEAAEFLSTQSDENTLAVLRALNPLVARQILDELPEETQNRVLALAGPETEAQWKLARSFPEESVGWIMERPSAVLRPQLTVREAVEALRKITRKYFVTYAWVADAGNVLLGVLTFRDLMFAEADARIEDVMHRDVFKLDPELALPDAMKATLNRHYPVYPVCDAQGQLLGQLRGQSLFEARAIEISAQPGAMVGVGNEERISTPVRRSLRMRHPWLQVNLLTAFVAAFVVGCFEDTLDRIVILAAFLPVLAGQSGNTGCQSLAVCLRGITLGDFKSGEERKFFRKEALLGFWNGALVGLVAASGMCFYAVKQHHPAAFTLAGVVFVAMTVSCIVSGLSGATIPLVLRRFGADPATASSIFLTTATDVVSMGTFLALATWLVP